MTLLSLRLARALDKGRAAHDAPARNRAELLATLLRKRAAAHNAGAGDLEALLRDQIRWALPIEAGGKASGRDEADSAEAAGSGFRTGIS
ncbi:hypothetical protein [Stakelama tenebrarum]|uniref:Uncharacterized protein n=1 Tax=Stakelama tenebrarum TaxID=2711215 RepID=A0A6G6Y174_9SPHN|nr:hypothetical protein [Sphingosinithalassobacter tenebrarum]QIG78672.1 hypothetical protein G5C33_01960 [Sphingosinithalassobacter tenebrarum]